ncbi:MAG: mechanosensitive ion channel family protein [Chloroflexota bacterium]
MGDLSTQINDGIKYLSTNALELALGAVVLFVLYKLLRPWVHRVLVGVMKRNAIAAGAGAPEQAEIGRRVATVEDLLAKLLRALMLTGFGLVFLGVFNLWSLLTGLGLVAAALTFAGQSIILDLIMGVLILTEGQYFKGDTVQLGGIEGTVEEVGIRRTVIRDMRGTVHSISNGIVRQSANLTRTFALATIEIDGVADRDVEAVIGILDAVGAAMAADPEWAGQFHEAAAYAGTIRLSAGGATLRMSGRVRPEMRAGIEQDMRRRIAASLAAGEIELIRPAAYQGNAAGR